MAKGSVPDSGPAKKELVQKFFSDLETQRALLANCAAEWKRLVDHFLDLEKTLHKKLEELLFRGEDFEVQVKDGAAKGGEGLLQRVQEQRDSAIAAILEQRESAIAAILEDKQKWVGAPRDGEELKVVSSTGVASTAAVAKTENVPVSASNGPAKTHNGPAKTVVSDALTSKTPTIAKGAASNVPGSKDPGAKADLSSVKVRPEIKKLCDNMDGEGLMKFLVDHRKEKVPLRLEVPSALQGAIDPSRLVLKALEGYHKYELAPVPDKEAGAWPIRCACIILLEALTQVLADPVLGADHPVVPLSIKSSARDVAKRWKSKLDSYANAGNLNCLDAQAFLQLLATFGIATEYNSDELCKLVIPIAWRKQTPALCRPLGLTSKIPDLVDKLVKDGKQLEALSFAHAFGIMDKVQPVLLLKEYLKEAQKATSSATKDASNVAAGQNEAITKELSALRAVLKAIEEYKLESQYPTVPLRQQVEKLEKTRAERKRAAAAVKTQAKKPRYSDTPNTRFFNAAAAQATPAAANAGDKGQFRQVERGQYGGAQSYNLSTPRNFDRRPQAGFGAMTYNVGARSPRSSLPGSFPYTQDGMGAMYGATPTSYPNVGVGGAFGGYAYENTVPPPSTFRPFKL